MLRKWEIETKGGYSCVGKRFGKRRHERMMHSRARTVCQCNDAATFLGEIHSAETVPIEEETFSDNDRVFICYTF